MVKAKQARRYVAPRRAQQAVETRAKVLAAARALFGAQGYAPTTIAEIAARAGVHPDTVYAAVGPKGAVLRELVETAISGAPQAIAAEDRAYVAEIRGCGRARGKLAIYARASTEILGRLTPLFQTLMEASPTEPDCAALWREIESRRAENMLVFARDLRATGALRSDLSDRDAADIVWSLNGPQHYRMLVEERRWPPHRFQAWLEDAWARLLLADPQGDETPGSRTGGDTTGA